MPICGMPLSIDPGSAGTECDGRKSQTWCSLCYKGGDFVGKNCTVGQMQDLVEQEMKKQGYS